MLRAWPTVLRAWPTMLRVGMAEMIAYRAEMVVWILTSTLPLVMLALWSAAVEGGAIQGMGSTEIGRYFAATLVVRQVTGAWVVWELNQMIRTGSLSPQLLRPVNPLLFNLAETLAAIPIRLAVLLPLLLLLVWSRPELVFLPGPTAALLGGISMLLALALAWLVQVIFGLLAFWLDQSTGLFNLWFAAWGLLSGYLVPLSLLPSGLLAVARYLPFAASLSIPVELLTESGRCGPEMLAVQLGWVALAGLLARWLWHRGLRRYGAVGA